MYYIPAGILAKMNPAWVDQAVVLGVAPDKLDHLNGGTFVVGNLLPVSLGNIVGGSLFVGILYWPSFIFKDAETPHTNMRISSASNTPGLNKILLLRKP